jgi:hypothetical protein
VKRLQLARDRLAILTDAQEKFRRNPIRIHGCCRLGRRTS